MKSYLQILIIQTFITIISMNLFSSANATSPPKGFQLTDIVNQYYGKPPAERTVMNLFPSTHVSYTNPPPSRPSSSYTTHTSNYEEYDKNGNRARLSYDDQMRAQATQASRRAYAREHGLSFGSMPKKSNQN